MVLAGCAPAAKTPVKVATNPTAKPTTKPPIKREVILRAVEFSPDNQHFVVAKRITTSESEGYISSIEVWDAKKRQPISKWSIKGIAAGIAFMPDNRLAIWNNPKLEIWNWKKPQRVKTMLGKSSQDVLTVSSSGQLLASSGTIWRVEDGKTKTLIRSDTSVPVAMFVRVAAFSPNEKILVTGAWDVDNGVEGFDVQTGRRIWQAEGDQEGNIAFSPTGKIVAVVTTAGIVLLKPATGRKIRLIKRDDVRYGANIRFLDAKTLVFTGEKSRVFYAIPSGKILKKEKYSRNDNEVFAPDDSFGLRFVGAEKTVKFLPKK